MSRLEPRVPGEIADLFHIRRRRRWSRKLWLSAVLTAAAVVLQIVVYWLTGSHL